LQYCQRRIRNVIAAGVTVQHFLLRHDVEYTDAADGASLRQQPGVKSAICTNSGMRRPVMRIAMSPATSALRSRSTNCFSTGSWSTW
jgi:hypothetical protein